MPKSVSAEFSQNSALQVSRTNQQAVKKIDQTVSSVVDKFMATGAISVAATSIATTGALGAAMILSGGAVLGALVASFGIFVAGVMMAGLILHNQNNSQIEKSAQEIEIHDEKSKVEEDGFKKIVIRDEKPKMAEGYFNIDSQFENSVQEIVIRDEIRKLPEDGFKKYTNRIIKTLFNEERKAENLTVSEKATLSNLAAHDHFQKLSLSQQTMILECIPQKEADEAVRKIDDGLYFQFKKTVICSSTPYPQSLAAIGGDARFKINTDIEGIRLMIEKMTYEQAHVFVNKLNEGSFEELFDHVFKNEKLNEAVIIPLYVSKHNTSLPIWKQDLLVKALVDHFEKKEQTADSLEDKTFAEFSLFLLRKVTLESPLMN